MSLMDDAMPPDFTHCWWTVVKISHCAIAYFSSSCKCGVLIWLVYGWHTICDRTHLCRLGICYSSRFENYHHELADFLFSSIIGTSICSIHASAHDHSLLSWQVPRVRANLCACNSRTLNFINDEFELRYFMGTIIVLICLLCRMKHLSKKRFVASAQAVLLSPSSIWR